MMKGSSRWRRGSMSKQRPPKPLNKFIDIMSNQEAVKSIAPPPLDSPPFITTALKVSQPYRVKPGIPSNFDRDRAQGCTFLMSCELYISFTASDFVDEQVRIHWAPSYFKGRHAASFAKHILQQEMRSGMICFTSWSNFTEESVLLVFCPENEATRALMWLKSNRYFQGRQKIEAYIDKFKDLVDLSSYTDPITIVLKFH
jgi:hypothetical protein